MKEKVFNKFLFDVFFFVSVVKCIIYHWQHTLWPFYKSPKMKIFASNLFPHPTTFAKIVTKPILNERHRNETRMLPKACQFLLNKTAKTHSSTYKYPKMQKQMYNLQSYSRPSVIDDFWGLKIVWIWKIIWCAKSSELTFHWQS